MEIYKTTKPATRWWWFADGIKHEDIAFQLDWLKENGFGGVEIAWVYPLPDSKAAPKWLSQEWSDAVAFAKHYSSRIGLFCDFTFGSLWPFGGSIVDESMSSRDFSGLSPQRLRKSWEGGEHFILNHLSKDALEKYSQKMTLAMKDALEGEKSGLFCDSWEVKPEGLWSEGLDQQFKSEFGYDISQFADSLVDMPEMLYDYRKFIAKVVNEQFYKPFSDMAHKNNCFTRIQAHGSPTNLLDSYACADVPESEAILFDPHFSQFAASSAALSGKNIVSSETFTCLYGWKGYPGPGQCQFEEDIEDLRMLADALFANGVNMIFWHGCPYNPDEGNNSFYASVHVGQKGSLAPHLKPFNAYMENVSNLMRQGKPFFDCACYLPMEDNWMKGEVDQDQKRPSAQYHWELHYQKFPKELDGFRPCWVSGEFLKKAVVCDRKTVIGTQSFDFLYIDCDYLDFQSLWEILRLAKDGAQIIMPCQPEEPGFIQHERYDQILVELKKLPNVSENIGFVPFVKCSKKLEFWVRDLGGRLVVFVANPSSVDISYPLDYKQSERAEAVKLDAQFNCFGKDIKVCLEFEKNRPLLVTLNKEKAETTKLNLEGI